MKLLGFLHAFLECTTDRKEVFPSFHGVVERVLKFDVVYMERCARKDGDLMWVISFVLSSRAHLVERGSHHTGSKSKRYVRSVLATGKDHTRLSQGLLHENPENPVISSRIYSLGRHGYSVFLILAHVEKWTT